MIVEERDNEVWAELFWDDLISKTQKELLNLMGDNGNYDVFPIATINVSPEKNHEGS